MYTRLNEIVDKKSNILSKILKVDPKSLKESKLSQSHISGIDTNMIRNIQERINNRLFNLSIADYELMCGNKMISKMMSKVLDCNERQLKKFCKYINVFNREAIANKSGVKEAAIRHSGYDKKLLF